MMEIGSIYMSGTIGPYVHSYYGLKPDNRLEADLIPLEFAFNMITMPIGSYFIQKNTHPKIMIGIGAVLFFSLFYGAIY